MGLYDVSEEWSSVLGDMLDHVLARFVGRGRSTLSSVSLFILVLA